MSIKDVLYRVVHSYPGGVAALAARMGRNPNTLQSKINPNLDTHHTTVEEIELIQTFANTDEIAKYFASQRNMVCIPVTEHQGASDVELIDLIIGMDEKRAGWLGSIKRAISDGVIDPIEAGRIRTEYLAHVAAMAELTNRVEGMVTERRKVAR